MHLAEPEIIRTATLADCVAIANIYNQAIQLGGITLDDRHFVAADIQTWIARFGPRETLLVLERRNHVLGWGIIKRYSDRAGYRFCCETSIYLAQSEIGQGYGKRLFQHLIQTVQDFGYHHVVAKIVAKNQSSIAFHEQFGFELVGIQKEIGCLKDQWHDIAILQLVFPPRDHSKP